MYVILDLLVFLLVCVPILGGGFWIHRPHLKLELTELAVPVLIVFAYAALIRRMKGPIGGRSWTLREARRLFERWRELLFRRPPGTILLATAFMSLLWACASLRRHWALQSNGFDLGIFTNVIWNLTHGNGYLSSVKGGINLFADHQSAIFWAFAPFFSVFPSPDILLILQAVALAAGGGAVFVLGRQYRKDASWLGAALPLLYWAYLPLRRAILFDFHPEVLMLPLFLWAIAGIHSRRRTARIFGWLAFAAALACKESAGPIAAGIGLAWILGAGPDREEPQGRSRGQARGWIALGAGLLVFGLDLRVVPSLLGGHYAYGSLYTHLRQGPGEWFRSLLGPARIKFLAATLAPLAFLPLLAPRALLAALPAYLMLFLSAGNSRLSLQFHYGIEPAIGLFWALAASQPRLSRSFTRYARALPVWVLFWALLSFGRSEIYWIRRYEPSHHAIWLRDRVAACLQTGTSLSASGALVPQVAARRWIRQIPDLRESDGSLDDCVWVDDSLNNWPMAPEQLRKWEARLTGELGYQRFYDCGSTRIYQRQNFAGACLRCMPECPDSPVDSD